MALCYAKENVLDTLKDSTISGIIEESVLESIAAAVVKNLGIEHEKFPKWL